MVAFAPTEVQCAFWPRSRGFVLHGRYIRRGRDRALGAVFARGAIRSGEGGRAPLRSLAVDADAYVLARLQRRLRVAVVLGVDVRTLRRMSSWRGARGGDGDLVLRAADACARLRGHCPRRQRAFLRWRTGHGPMRVFRCMRGSWACVPARGVPPREIAICKSSGLAYIRCIAHWFEDTLFFSLHRIVAVMVENFSFSTTKGIVGSPP